jgi:hypothetical protein
MLEIWYKSSHSWPIIDFPTWMLHVFLNLPVSVRQLKYPRVQTLRIFEGVNTVYRILGIPTFLPFFKSKKLMIPFECKNTNLVNHLWKPYLCFKFFQNISEQTFLRIVVNFQIYFKILFFPRITIVYLLTDHVLNNNVLVLFLPYMYLEKLPL